MNKTLEININSIHTTQLGLQRISRNISIEVNDVEAWCKNAVKNADIIFSMGKNNYVYSKGNVITLHKGSNSVITAHRINPTIREIKVSEYECLREYLYQAIYVPKGSPLPSRDVLDIPEIYIYIKDFGLQKSDLCVVAVQNNQIIGAAWTRIIPAYGYLDDETPELAISLLPEFRGYGIGTKLMDKLFTLLKNNGYTKTSLSVQKENLAFKLYQRLGYEIFDEREEDYLMVKQL